MDNGNPLDDITDNITLSFRCIFNLIFKVY